MLPGLLRLQSCFVLCSPFHLPVGVSPMLLGQLDIQLRGVDLPGTFTPRVQSQSDDEAPEYVDPNPKVPSMRAQPHI